MIFCRPYSYGYWCLKNLYDLFFFFADSSILAALMSFAATCSFCAPPLDATPWVLYPYTGTAGIDVKRSSCTPQFFGQTTVLCPVLIVTGPITMRYRVIQYNWWWYYIIIRYACYPTIQFTTTTIAVTEVIRVYPSRARSDHPTFRVSTRYLLRLPTLYLTGSVVRVDGNRVSEPYDDDDDVVGVSCSLARVPARVTIQYDRQQRASEIITI